LYFVYLSPNTLCAPTQHTHTHTHTHPHTHKLLYPYTNALAVNTVYGVSVAYCAGRVGCPGTHRSLSRSLACLLACMLARTHARVHIRMLSLYLALPLSQGVNQHHGRWIARYSEAGKNINLGSFSTQEEAAEAWDAKARECGMRERERETERERLFVCVLLSVCLPVCRCQMCETCTLYIFVTSVYIMNVFYTVKKYDHSPSSVPHTTHTQFRALVTQLPECYLQSPHPSQTRVLASQERRLVPKTQGPAPGCAASPSHRRCSAGTCANACFE